MNTLTSAAEARIRAALPHATPGDWQAYAANDELDCRTKYETKAAALVYADADCEHHPVVDCSCNHTCRDEAQQEANAEYVAACNPEAMALLLAELQRLRESMGTLQTEAYAEGRADQAEEDGWQPIESAPKNQFVLLAAEFDGPGYWRIKMGVFCTDEKQYGWRILGGSWTPTRWRPLPPPPKEQ